MPAAVLKSVTVAVQGAKEHTAHLLPVAKLLAPLSKEPAAAASLTTLLAFLLE